MRCRLLLLFLPLALFAGDAGAWGLQTHLFFAQYALLALPLADPRLRAAAAALPQLVLAGACLPDLALAGRAMGTAAFCRTHRWTTLRRMAGTAASQEERAIAIGYASHLIADVVAHTHFVPEHERRIAPVAHVTHALCEWAMDHFLHRDLFAAPADLLRAEAPTLAAVAARHCGCRETLARRALDWLAGAERALRGSGLPRLCRAIARRFDPHLEPRFEAYVRETAGRLSQIGAVLEGAEADGEPEPSGASIAASARRRAPGLLLPASLH